MLADSIEEGLRTEKYQTQSARKDNGLVEQAETEGLLRELLAADRAFTITPVGEPNDLKVPFGRRPFSSCL